MKKTGETQLEKILANMEPILNEGEYVFATVSDLEKIPRNIIVGEVRESEGTTVILLKKEAESLDLSFEFVASWITLNIHSALDAIGLTAAFSTALAENNISCNVLSGYYHDHIFVEKKDETEAMKVLVAMSNL